MQVYASETSVLSNPKQVVGHPKQKLDRLIQEKRRALKLCEPQFFRLWHVLALVALSSQTTFAETAEPLKLHPDNPHYLLFRGKPTVLIGSSEHYGAVMNRDFDYVRYLDTLHLSGLNVTRVFSGQYRERAGKFGVLPEHRAGQTDLEIVENTLAPNANAYIAPWPRTEIPGAIDGRNKFDLSRWNPEYFERLKDFMQQASRRGIVVEVSLFSPYYVGIVGDHFWEISPWNWRNNVNDIGKIDGTDALTLKDEKLVAVQEALVRKLVEELQDFDNLYYEICNEPHFGRVPVEWQAHIAKVVIAAEASLGARHLLLQEFADRADAKALEKIKIPSIREGHRENGVEKRLPEVSLLAFHTAQARVVTNNYNLAKPIGDNESVRIVSDASNRLNAWRLILAGGAFHHGTDYSFTRGHEDGSFVVPAGGAGGGSPELRRQLGVLRRFMDGLDFVHMSPTTNVIRSDLPAGTQFQILANAPDVYVIYVSHERPRASEADGAIFASAEVVSEPQQVSLVLQIPKGRYTARWVNTKTAEAEKETAFLGGPRAGALESPSYSEDIVLVVSRSN
jgi:hypothetical protein